MTLLQHWPIAAIVSWVALGAWLVKKKNRAQQPLPEGTAESLGRGIFRRFLQNRAAVRASTVLYGIAALCIIGPWILEAAFGFTNKTGDPANLNRLPPAWWKIFGYDLSAGTPRFAPPIHLAGTEALGRDLFLLILEGGRISLLIGITATVIALTIGLIYGAVAGYAGGKIDQMMMRSVDIVYALPYMVMVIVIMALFGRSMAVLFLAIGFTSWLTLSRIARAEVMTLKQMEFVEAAVAAGTPRWRIVLVHLIPNTLGPVVVQATTLVPRIMLEEAFLSFLGFGVQPPQASWGVLIATGVEFMRYYPWLVVMPLLFFFPTLLSLNFLGDGLRDALDPRVRGFEGRKRSKKDIVPASVPDDPRNVLEIGDVHIEFDTGEGASVNAVNGVSLTLQFGETLAIVGESGSGKTVATRALMGLLPTPPAVITKGTAWFEKTDLLRLSEDKLRALRGNRIAMVFQDAMAALNPYLSVGTQLLEALQTHRKMPKRDALQECVAMLERVGIPAPKERMRQYPHELSGGMRQRVMIAMALLCKPSVLICDEPTTALDVTVQAKILDLLRKLKEEVGTAIIFITHDLGVVGEVADRIAVMYAGRLVEVGTAREVIRNPQHPYTQGLLASHPPLTGARKALTPIPGEPPDMRKLPPGCAFAPRCTLVHAGCMREFPPIRRYTETHSARCVKEVT